MADAAIDKCANCGCPIDKAPTVIGGGILEPGEWVCSDECYEEYDEKGCPLEHGTYRYKTHNKY
jgi:hypothetical protein